MELKFENQGTSWVAEFEVTGDFNLHVERVSGGRFLVYQKSVADGEYDLVDGLGYKDHKDTIDMDFVALVYPKWIKVVSEAEVTRAVVLPEGVAKPVVAFRTEYDANIYEDRKALYENLKALLPASTEDTTRVILPTSITVHCPWDWSAIVDAIDWPNSDTINMWQNDGTGDYNYVLSVDPERKDYNVYISD